MSENQDRNLAAIRSLIAHSEIYRGVFARTAWIAGVLSILTAGVIYVNDEVNHFLERPVRPREFAFAWMDVLFLTLIVGAWFMYRSRPGDGEGAGFSRTRFALKTILPLTLIPIAFTAWFLGTGYLGATELELVAVWISFYGLVLLATGFFAPSSVVTLGWAFLLTGLAVPALADRINYWVDSVPTVLMGVSFGVYHLIFAALVSMRRQNPDR